MVTLPGDVHLERAVPLKTKDLLNGKFEDKLSHKRSRLPQIHIEDTGHLDDQLTTLHDSIDAVSASITGIHSSLERFEGLSSETMQQRRRSTVADLRHGLGHHHVFAANVDAEDDLTPEEALQARLLQYRFVKKIEPEVPPMERLPPPELERVGDGSFAVGNTSEEAVQSFAPRARVQAQAKNAEKRDRKMALARARRLDEEQQKEVAALAKIHRYDERMADMAKKHEATAVAISDGTAGPERAMQARKWQTAWVMLGFLQMSVKVVKRYNDVKGQYAEFLHKENMPSMDPYGQRGLAVHAGEHMLAMKFVEVARKHILNESAQTLQLQEWRLPPKQRAPWCLTITSKSEALSALEKAKKPAPSYQSAEKDSRKQIHVEIQDARDMAGLQRNALILQAMMVAKFRRRRRRKEAAGIAHALGRWHKGAVLVRLLHHVACAKRIQRFWRWGMRHLAEVQTHVELDWKRLEKLIDPPPRVKTVVSFGQEAVAGAEGSQEEPKTHAGAIMSRALRRNKSVTAIVDEDPEATDHRRDRVLHHSSCLDGRKAGPSSVMRAAAMSVMREDQRRRDFLKLEMRKRRYKYLPVYEVWLGDMEFYWRDVHDWREHRKACESRCVKPSMELPEMPPCPSHLPTEEDLLEMVRQAPHKAVNQASQKLLARQATRKQTSTKIEKVGRVARLAMAAAITTASRNPPVEEPSYKAMKADPEGGRQLCAEVADMLAPTASHPVPVARSAFERPDLPCPL